MSRTAALASRFESNTNSNNGAAHSRGGTQTTYTEAQRAEARRILADRSYGAGSQQKINARNVLYGGEQVTITGGDTCEQVRDRSRQSKEELRRSCAAYKANPGDFFGIKNEECRCVQSVRGGAVTKAGTRPSAPSRRSLASEFEEITYELQMFINKAGVELNTDDLSMEQLQALIELHDSHKPRQSKARLNAQILAIFEGDDAQDVENLENEDEEDAEQGENNEYEYDSFLVDEADEPEEEEEEEDEEY